MHVSIRHGDQSRRHPRSRYLQNIGIIGGGPADRGKLIGNGIGFTQMDQAIGNLGVDVRASKNDRPGAERDVTMLLFIDFGTIRCVGHVNRDRNRGHDTAGGGLGAPQADFFLDGCHAMQVALQRLSRLSRHP